MFGLRAIIAKPFRQQGCLAITGRCADGGEKRALAQSLVKLVNQAWTGHECRPQPGQIKFRLQQDIVAFVYRRYSRDVSHKNGNGEIEKEDKVHLFQLLVVRIS